MLILLTDDVESAKTSLRGQNVSSAEAKKQGEEWAQIAGSKIDNTVCILDFIVPCSIWSQLKKGSAYRSITSATRFTRPTRLSLPK